MFHSLAVLLLSLPVGQPPIEVIHPDLPPYEKVWTIQELEKCFQPLPGIHVIKVCHPVTKKEVCVSFKLPEGCPKVDRCCNRLTFDYGPCEVKLIFRIGGRVDVRYDD